MDIREELFNIMR